MEAGLLSPQTVYNIHHAIERVNTMRKHKKAYQVDADEQSVIVFEHTNVAARRIGANRMDTEFEYIERCRRAPHFDEYHWTEKVPPEALLEAGWWFECSYGYGRVTAEECPYYYVSDKGDVFKDFSAYESYMRDQVLRKINHLSAIRKTRRKFPFAKRINFCQSYREHKEYGKCDIVTFLFSEKAKGSAEWLVGTDIIYVQKQDVEAWNEVKDLIKK